MPDKPQSNNGIAGLWLGTGASLLIIALVFHGPPDPDLSVQMHHVAEGHMRWALVHWTAAVALFLLSGAGFLNLTDQNAGGSSTGPRSAWLVFALGALLTVSTAISEAAVVSVAANAGDKAAFNSWWAFGGGMGNGFFALALATALIALQKRAAMPQDAHMVIYRRDDLWSPVGGWLESRRAFRYRDWGSDLAHLNTPDVRLACLVWVRGPAPSSPPKLPKDCVSSNARRIGDLT